MVRDRVQTRVFSLLRRLFALAPLSAAAQGKASTPSRTPDGKPNLEGIFSFSTITPLQRPDALAGKDTLTDEEAAAFEASENKRLNRDLFDPDQGTAERRIRAAGRRAACCPTTSSGTSAATG